MRRIAISALLLLLLLPAAVVPAALAEPATPEEAEALARAYLRLVIAKYGGWGDVEDAALGRMREMRGGRHLLAYVFDVEPDGYIVVSRHKEIAAVKAHGPGGRFDPDATGGMVALIREELELTIEAIVTASAKAIEDVTYRDWEDRGVEHYRGAWDYLLSPDFDPASHERPKRSRTAPGMDYQEGDVMLDSHWHQKPPYNDQCPDLGCEWPNHDYYNTRALVGCVATAGVQITRYWAWPTCSADGEYVDRYWWTRMPSIVSIYSPQYQIDAVAAASRSVGISVGMDYGCEESGAWTYDMEQVFENRRYNTGCSVIYRSGYNTTQWFNLCKGQCEDNQPAQYRVRRHSVVMDGFREEWIGGVLEMQLHMNYGWNVGDNTWYTMNQWPLYDGGDEYIVRGIRPDVSLWDIAGYYSRPSDPGVHFDKPVRYFKKDAVGTNATFQAGHSFQYLRPGFWLRNTGGSSDSFVFNGAPSYMTEFYHRAPFGDVRVKIHDGAIKVYGGGEICFR